MDNNLKRLLDKISLDMEYYKYFDTWIENLTENQILYYIAYSKGKKSPYAN